MLVLDREEFDTFLIIKELFAGLPCPVFRLCSYDFVGFDHLRPSLCGDQVHIVKTRRLDFFSLCNENIPRLSYLIL